MKQNKKIPTLRFPEFSGEWEVKELGEISTFLKGKGVSKSDIVENGNLECIRYGELYTHYNEVIFNIKSKTNIDKYNLVLSKKNDVIIPASGETSLEIAKASCVLKNDIALGGDLNIIRSNLNGIFLSYYLNNRLKENIASLAQGNSVVHLYSSQLKTLKLKVPLIQEQKKIADFILQIDNKIEKLTKKKELLEKYKKGVMQKIFNQEIRFKDDNDGDYSDWEFKELGGIGTFKSGSGFPESEQNGKEGVPFYKVSDMNLPLNFSEMIEANNYVSLEQINNMKFKVISEYAIIFAKVGAAIFLERKRKAQDFLIDNNMMAFIPKKENIDFIKYFFDTIFLSKYAQVGALPSYNGSDLQRIKISVPSLPEQTKIANFLTEIDKKINLTEKQLNGTKQYKKGLLQQMFI